jgi:hypothetical protein
MSDVNDMTYSGSTSNKETYAVLPSPGMICAYQSFKFEDPLTGSMVVDTTPATLVHRSWVAKDGRGNTAACFYWPFGEGSEDAYGPIGGPMPINQFPSGFKLCRYTPRGGEPWDFQASEADSFFRNAGVM